MIDLVKINILVIEMQAFQHEQLHFLLDYLVLNSYTT